MSVQAVYKRQVFKYTDTEVLVILPNLEPGEYSPVMMIHTGDKVDFTYTLPVSWKVLDERYAVSYTHLMAIAERGL